MSAKRTERLLTLVILLLSSKRGFSKEELFEEIELYREAPTAAAREKLFDRDKAMLREQGIPLESFSEDPLFETDNTVQRYRINAEEYQLTGVTFTAEEYTFLSLAAGMWDPASLDSAATRAMRKLSLRTPGAEPPAPLPVQPRIRTSEPYWDEVWRAMAARRTITFTYRAASTGREEKRTVRPWGMGSRFGHWYLVGFDTDRQAERFFRLSRMTSPPALREGGFEPPESFDINAALASLTRRDAEGTAELLVRPGTCNVLRVRRGAVLVEHGEEWDRLRVPYTGLPALAAEVAGFGANAAVTAPAELGASVRHLLTGALAAARATTEVVLTAGQGTAPRRKSSAQDHLLRLLDLVPYLLAHPGAGLRETAQRFDVSEAQLTRDLDLLFVSGPRHYPDGLMDVDVEGGRIYLSNARNLSQPVRLAMDEACTLIVGLQALRELPGIAAHPALATAQAKLTAAAGDAARMGTVMATRLSEDEVHPHLELFQEALRRGVQIEMSYLVPARDQITDRVIEPVRAFSQDDLWYVEAWCTGSAGFRNFRLDRIQDARLTDRPVTRGGEAGPAGPPPAPSAGLYTPSPDDRSVVLVLKEPARWIAAQYNAVRTEEQGGGTLAAELRVGSVAWLPGLMAGLGGAAAVAGPGDVRREVLRWLEAALASTTT
ncbi:helix-turn-helix transcriptional regulator [Arthrobacter sp. TMN-37]